MLGDDREARETMYANCATNSMPHPFNTLVNCSCCGAPFLKGRCRVKDSRKPGPREVKILKFSKRAAPAALKSRRFRSWATSA